MMAGASPQHGSKLIVSNQRGPLRCASQAPSTSQAALRRALSITCKKGRSTTWRLNRSSGKEAAGTNSGLLYGWFGLTAAGRCTAGRGRHRGCAASPHEVQHHPQLQQSHTTSGEQDDASPGVQRSWPSGIDAGRCRIAIVDGC